MSKLEFLVFVYFVILWKDSRWLGTVIIASASPRASEDENNKTVKTINNTK